MSFLALHKGLFQHLHPLSRSMEHFCTERDSNSQNPDSKSGAYAVPPSPQLTPCKFPSSHFICSDHLRTSFRLGSRARTCNLPRPRRVNNHRYLPSFKTLRSEVLLKRQFNRSSFLQRLGGSSRTRTYTLRRDLIYSQTSQPIAQHFQIFVHKKSISVGRCLNACTLCTNYSIGISPALEYG